MKKIISFLLSLLPFLIGGFIGGFLMTLLLNSNVASAFLERFNFLSNFSILYFLLSAPLWWYVMILLHELGHLIAGIFCKFNFYFLSVGPVKVEKKQDGLTFSRHRFINVAGGLTLMIPDEKYNNKTRWLIFIAAGPLASLVVGIMLFLFLMSQEAGQLNIFLVNTLLGVALSSLFIGFVLSAIPMNMKELGGNDGQMILDIYRGGKGLEIRNLFFKLINASIQGTRPAFLNRSDIASLIHFSKNVELIPQITGHFFAYNHYLERKRIKKAQFHIKCADKLTQTEDGALIRPSILLEQAWLSLILEKDIELAKSLVSEAEKGYHQVPALKRVHAAIALLNGDVQLAKKEAEIGIKEAKRDYDKGGNLFEIEMLELLKDGIVPAMN